MPDTDTRPCFAPHAGCAVYRLRCGEPRVLYRDAPGSQLPWRSTPVATWADTGQFNPGSPCPDPLDIIGEYHAPPAAELATTTAGSLNGEFRFVPDSHGGHYLSGTGDKWYPECHTEKMVAELRAENERLKWSTEKLSNALASSTERNRDLRVRNTSCCFCKAQFAAIESLRAHSAVCLEHPAVKQLKSTATQPPSLEAALPVVNDAIKAGSVQFSTSKRFWYTLCADMELRERIKPPPLPITLSVPPSAVPSLREWAKANGVEVPQ